MGAHRDFCQRQHRVLGHFVAIQAWLRGLDCVVLVRQDLEVFLGLERFKEERVEWLREDLQPWFKHASVDWAFPGRKFRSLWLSRFPMEKWLSKNDDLMMQQRIAELPRRLRAGAFLSALNGQHAATESVVVQYMAVLDSGLSDPHSLFEASNNVP